MCAYECYVRLTFETSFVTRESPVTRLKSWALERLHR